MKKFILTFTALVLFSSAALAFQVTSEPTDFSPSQFVNMANVNSADIVDDLNASFGEDHEVHIEDDSRHRVRQKNFNNRLLK